MQLAPCEGNASFRTMLPYLQSVGMLKAILIDLFNSLASTAEPYQVPLYHHMCRNSLPFSFWASINLAFPKVLDIIHFQFMRTGGVHYYKNKLAKKHESCAHTCILRRLLLGTFLKSKYMKKKIKKMLIYEALGSFGISRVMIARIHPPQPAREGHLGEMHDLLD